MKKHFVMLLLTALLMALCGTALAGWGFVDGSGSTVVEPIWSGASSFSEGFVVVTSKQNGVYHAVHINREGEILAGQAWGRAGQFKEGRAAVRVDGKWGFIDTTGAFTVLPAYDYALDYQNGCVVVYNGPLDRDGYNPRKGDYYLLNMDGDVLCHSTDSMSSVYDGCVLLKSGSVYSFYRVATGETFGPFADAKRFQCGYASVKNDQGLWGIIDATGKLVQPHQYYGAVVLSDQCFMAQSGGQHCIFSIATGEKLRSFDYVGTYALEEKGYTYAYNGPLGEYGIDYGAESGDFYIIGPDGSVVSGPVTIANSMTIGKQDFWFVKMRGKWGLRALTGETMVRPAYEYVRVVNDDSGFFMAQKNGRYGVVTLEGVEMDRFKWDDAMAVSEGLAAVKDTDFPADPPDLLPMVVQTKHLPDRPGLPSAIATTVAVVAPEPTATPVPAATPEPAPDFRSLRWGMTQSQVEAIEGVSFAAATEVPGKQAWYVEMDATVTGEKCVIRFYFCNEGLYRADYSFHQGFNTASMLAPRYETFVSAMQQKYGRPDSQAETWQDAAKQQTYANRTDEALDAGYLTYHVRYTLQRTTVNIHLDAAGERTPFFVTYESTVVAPQEAQQWFDDI